ncbi:hypothetical protein KR093_003859 [Drosophila rubida]|uniref:Peptidase S1 domain-containing protein n=1 Tax=Drosophila rubida TaxID=30044 RepID=A0AAD4KCV9_9MUSC|nr:hypothetical protein KR093_003859 [Drosophila rubida]
MSSPLHLHLLQVSLLLTLSVGQQLPENACAQHFRYVQSGFGGFHGELTLPLQNGRNRIDVRFSQRGQQDVFVVGALLPHPDDATVRANFLAAKFRLSLWPDAKGILPKLTRLSFNEATLCTASDYGPPSSFFNRFYVIDYNARQATATAPAPALLNGFRGGNSDVDVKTVFINAPAGRQLPVDKIPDFINSWINEPSSTAAAAAPSAAWSTTVQLPWPTAPPTSATTATVIPLPPPLPAFNEQAVPRSAFFSCGQEGLTTPFIQRGKEFPRGQYPWLTAVFHKENFALAFKCGGSLISATLVITAAHCVYKMKEDRVVVSMGRYDLDNYHEEGEQGRDVVRILTHPDYSSRLQLQPDADLALVTLHRPVIFNDIIRPICLWESAESEVTVEVGTVAGWGTDELGNSMTRYPRVVEAKIATEADCARQWKVQRVMERTICAGNLDGSGPCLGDSGGGLMIKRNNRWLLRGIVSQGERSTVGHCNLNQYVLYCDLSKHAAWIRQNLN